MSGLEMQETLYFIFSTQWIQRHIAGSGILLKMFANCYMYMPFNGELQYVLLYKHQK